jgi:hypothetical protein
MSKFSSFIVFAFGLVLIVGTMVAIVRTRFFPEPPPPPEERLVLPNSDLEPLDVGTRDEFLAQLDKIFLAGGLDEIHDYVEKEWVPGRLVRASIFATQDLARARIVDREVRRCDRQGIDIMDKAPVLARATPDLHVGKSVHLETWMRAEGTESFHLIVWFVGQ